jgi:excisionase family DNA binding protein
MNEDQNEYRLLSKTLAAKYLGIGKDKLDLLTANGRIKFIQIGNRRNYPVSSLKEFIETNLMQLIPDENDGNIFELDKKTETTKVDPLNSDLILKRIILEKSYGKCLPKAG